MSDRQANTFVFVFLTIFLLAAQPALAVNSITGNSSDYLSIAAMGDFNGDTYPDVVVCSDHFGSSDSGGVRIFFAASGTSAVSGTVSVSTADVTFDGESADDGAGGSCAVGDVNGDNIDDIIVGANGFAYVVLGSSTLASASLSTAIQFTGDAASAAGSSVVTGDVNGDNIDDIIVGAIGNDDGGSDAGAVYVVLGSSTLASSSLSTAIQFTGEVAGDNAGLDLAAGDINHDSIDDIIIGAWNNDDGGGGSGAAYVVLGSATLASSSLSTAIQFTGEVAGDIAGSSVATGDVNGDSIDDIIVGAIGNDDGGSNAGAVYVILGTVAGVGSGSLSTATLQFMGEAAGDYTGFWALASGDMNSDGIDDIIIGSKNNSSSGAVYVVLGRQNWNRTNLTLAAGPKIRKFIGKASGDSLGLNVGFFAGSRTSKLIIGSALNDDGASSGGQVWLIRTLPGSTEGYQRTVP